jgi:hypothetical protein
MDQPNPVSIEDVALAVLGDLSKSPRLSQLLNLTAVDPLRLAREAEDLGEDIKLDLGLAGEGPKR